MKRNIIKTTWQGLIIVLSKPKYLILTFIIFVILMIVFIYLPIYKFLGVVLTNNVYDFIEKLKVFYFSLGSFITNFTTRSRLIAISVSILTAINLSMLTFYLRSRIKNERANRVGVIGTVVGVLGVGCASCGSVLLSAIFGIGATTTLLGVLPFKGVEFGLVGIGFILVSIYLLAKKLINPNVCKI